MCGYKLTGEEGVLGSDRAWGRAFGLAVREAVWEIQTLWFELNTQSPGMGPQWARDEHPGFSLLSTPGIQ